MSEYRVVWIESHCKEENIQAESFEDAARKWEDLGADGEIYFIEDPDGKQLVFNCM